MGVFDEHDYKAFPELSNSELESLGLSSPHEQIVRDFVATVVKVHDGDTVTLRVPFRDFDFPLRLRMIDAPELSTGLPGEEARDYLRLLVEGKEVLILVDPKNRVEKYGRLLGDVVIDGLNVGEVMIHSGFAVPFDLRREGALPDLNKFLGVDQWF